VASKTVVELFDDLDGGRANETVCFALDGVEYEIDLSSVNASRLRDMLTDYISAGHRVSGRSRSAPRTSAPVEPAPVVSSPSTSPSSGGGRTGGKRKAKAGSSNADMTAEIRRLASESAKKVSEAQAAAQAAEDDDIEPDLFNTAPDVLVEQQAQIVDQGVGPVPALIIPFQEAGL
jgi:hypothetical protein